MTFDPSELRRFEAALRRAPEILKGEVRPVVKKASLNVKNDFNDSFRGSRHFKGVAGSVNFETRETGDGIEAEIGPDKSRYPGIPGPGRTRPAAPIANIAIFGGARGGGTVADPQKHLDAEAPRLAKAMGDVIRKAIR